jgi:hypothetical protein
MSAASPGVISLHALFAHACLGAPDDARASDLGADLARFGVADEDAEALLASPRRLGLYRQLVRYNVSHVVGLMLGRTRARLEAHRPGAFDGSLAGFLADRGPRTPHLRDVPGEFLAWAAPRWRGDAELPGWLADFASLELVDFTLGTAPGPSPPPLAEVTAERGLVFSGPRVLLRLDWAVHEVPPGDLEAAPSRRPTHLLVYRDAEQCARSLDLTPLAAALLERLLEGRPLGAAMVEACAAEAHPLDDAVLRSAAQMLAELGERGVLLGARA